MPLVERRPGEQRDEFISRCMGDSKMIIEFPDNKQRYAVCISQSKK
jgi:hypothetical protein